MYVPIPCHLFVFGIICISFANNNTGKRGEPTVNAKDKSGKAVFLKSAAWTLTAFLLIAAGYFGAMFIADMLR